jgi:hypothetical protein
MLNQEDREQNHESQAIIKAAPSLRRGGLGSDSVPGENPTTKRRRRCRFHGSRLGYSAGLLDLSGLGVEALMA